MWSFLNPLFLWAAAAAAIPLLLHLLQKRRMVKVHFSTIRFLRLAQRRSANRVRLEQFLLWLLRTLLLLALALAFALPVLRTTGLAGLLGAAHRDVAIVWDVSYSMGYESGRQNVWETARAAAADIVRGLHSGDRVCLFLADQDVTPLIAQPTSDLDLALALIKAQSFQPVTSRLRPAIVAAIAALRDSGNREREVYVITDGQALPWAEFVAPELGGQRIAVFTALLGADHPQNTAPASVEVQPALLLTNTPARLLVKLLPGGLPQEPTVALYLDDAELGRRSAREELLFTLPPLSEGAHTLRVESAPDGLNVDNAFHSLLRVRDRVPVLVLGSETDAFFLMKALAPVVTTPWQATRLDAATTLPADLQDYACVFLCNALPLPGQSVLDLETYARHGGVVVVFPGDNATTADYANWQCLPARPSGVVDREPTRRSLRLERPGDPLFQSLRLPPGAVPAVTIRRALQFRPPPHPNPLPRRGEGTAESPASPPEGQAGPADARGMVSAGPGEEDVQVLLSAGADPFLLRRPFGAGAVLLLSVSADRRWSDLPLSPFFLPLVHQFVHYAAGTSGERTFQWTARELELLVNATELRGPDGQLVPVRVTKQEASVVRQLENAWQPGIYRWGDDPVLALNFQRAESDLTPLDQGSVPWPGGYVVRDVPALARVIEQHRIGRPLSELLLWVVLGLALLELFLANRAGRPAAKLTDRVTIHPSGRVLEKIR